MIGKTFSHYKILSKLGAGGMGVVYKAEDTKLKRTVALKFLPPELTRDPEAKERFIHEARAASALDHPHVCTIHEISETEDGQLFIAMACYKGETLKERLKGGALSVGEAAGFAEQMAKGLEKAHGEGIVHRDLKPANIFITDDGLVKILDFGLAKLSGQTKLTRTGTTLGTVSYMSPEQARGVEVDRRTDIWALGVVMYEMLSGKVPFEGEYPEAVIYSILHEEAKPLEKIRPEVPKGISDVVGKALVKELEGRYRSAEEVLADLEGIRKGEEVRIRRPRRKRMEIRKWLVPAGIMALVALAGLGFRYVLYDRLFKPRIMSILVIPFENQTGETRYDPLSRSIQESMITRLRDVRGVRTATIEEMRGLREKLLIPDTVEDNRELWLELGLYWNVRRLLAGNYTKSGTVFQINSQVWDTKKGKLLLTEPTSGEGEESILTDQVLKQAREIGSKLRRSNPEIVEADPIPYVEVTTNSWEAYKAYSKGLKAQDGFKFSEATEWFEKASILDSTFAMAYQDIVWGMGDNQRINNMLKKAIALSSNTTEKDRLFIEARYAHFIEKDQRKIFEKYRELIRKYPGEKRGYLWLALQYRLSGFNSKAIRFYQKALILDPGFGIALNNLVGCSLDVKNMTKATYFAGKYLEVCPDEINAHDTMGIIDFINGDFERALNDYMQVYERRSDSFMGTGAFEMGYIHALRGSHTEAQNWFEKWKEETKAYPSIYRDWQSFYAAWMGRFRESSRFADDEHDKAFLYYEKKAFDKARSSFYQYYHEVIEKSKSNIAGQCIWKIRALEDLSSIDLAQGFTDSAATKLDSMKVCISFLKKENMRRVDYDLWLFVYNQLKAEICIHSGKYNEAIQLGRQTLYMPPNEITGSDNLANACRLVHKDIIAQTYWKMGKLDEAITEYKRILSLDKKSNCWYLNHPLYYYRYARVLEEKGLKDHAIAEYEKLLKLWEGADESIPERIDAKERLAKLTGT